MPRKATVAVVVASHSDDGSAEPPSTSKKTGKEALSVDDLNLPKSIVQRLSKGVLPPNTQIQKDAVLAMSKSATVFVNYLTIHATEVAAKSNKKTVMPSDVFEAMAALEFDAFLPRLEAEVAKFTSIQADKRNSYRKKVREEKKALKGGASGATPASNGYAAAGAAAANANGDGQPSTKRARRNTLDNMGEHGSEDEDEGDADETMEVDDAAEEDEEVEDDDVEEDEEAGAEEGLAEDPIEIRDSEEDEDEMADGDESD